MSELKPCPFCGGEAEFKEGRQREDGMWKSGYVTCKDCGIPTAYSLSPTLFFGTTRNGWLTDKECHECSLTSIEAWNTRAEHTCYADELSHRRCKFSVNRGWIENTCTMNKTSWDDGQCTWGCMCSSCGNKFEHETGVMWNYCPNCGAKVVRE